MESYQAVIERTLLTTEQRRALKILKQNNSMTAAKFAIALRAEMPGTSTNECLEQLCRFGLVEMQIKTVGPVQYRLTSEGQEAVTK